MRTAGERKERIGPIVRFRSMAAGIVVVMGVIAVPLALVWKQSYITRASVRIEVMADTLSACNKRIAVLRLDLERLSRTERIEHFAREKLNLDYPTSDQIVIVAKDRARPGAMAARDVGKLLASARDYLSKSR